MREFPGNYDPQNKALSLDCLNSTTHKCTRLFLCVNCTLVVSLPIANFKYAYINEHVRCTCR